MEVNVRMTADARVVQRKEKHKRMLEAMLIEKNIAQGTEVSTEEISRQMGDREAKRRELIAIKKAETPRSSRKSRARLPSRSPSVGNDSSRSSIPAQFGQLASPTSPDDVMSAQQSPSPSPGVKSSPGVPKLRLDLLSASQSPTEAVVTPRGFNLSARLESVKDPEKAKAALASARQWTPPKPDVDSPGPCLTARIMVSNNHAHEEQLQSVVEKDAVNSAWATVKKKIHRSPRKPIPRQAKSPTSPLMSTPEDSAIDEVDERIQHLKP